MEAERYNCNIVMIYSMIRRRKKDWIQENKDFMISILILEVILIDHRRAVWNSFWHARMGVSNNIDLMRVALIALIQLYIQILYFLHLCCSFALPSNQNRTIRRLSTLWSVLLRSLSKDRLLKVETFSSKILIRLFFQAHIHSKQS